MAAVDPYQVTSQHQRAGGHDGDTSQSNTPTTRVSMVFLPSPPPHLLHSDQEDENIVNDNYETFTVSAPSIAETIKELQRCCTGHPSPGTLR